MSDYIVPIQVAVRYSVYDESRSIITGYTDYRGTVVGMVGDDVIVKSLDCEFHRIGGNWRILWELGGDNHCFYCNRLMEEKDIGLVTPDCGWICKGERCLMANLSGKADITIPYSKEVFSELRELGYTDREIYDMGPSIVQEIINKGISR